MPFIVREIIKDNPSLVTARLQEPVSSALAKMTEHDFSQLPVVDEDYRPLGLVTSVSILRALSHFGVGLDQLKVEHARVKADEFRQDADLFELLDRLRDFYAVLIVNAERRLIGIVTNYDTAEYFRRKAEDMMLVEDIETMLKDFIQAGFSAGDGVLNETKLDQAILQITDSLQAQRKKFQQALNHYLSLQSGGNVKLDDVWLQEVLDHHYPNAQPQKKLSDLTMYEYVQLLLHKDPWSLLEPVFNLEGRAVRNLLDGVRDIRNTLAHFRNEITSDQRERLHFAADWLAQRQGALANLVASAVASPPVVEPQPERAEGISPHAGVTSRPPLEDEAGPLESRFAPLAIWLQGQPPGVTHLTLDLAKIEEIIGGKLPESAYKHRSWWANDEINHPHSQQWLEVDWRVASVNMTSQVVNLARIQERQKAYIKFYGELINELRQQPEFNHLRVLPDGVSWYWTKSISVGGKGIASFNYSFGRGDIFRVELYIDAGDQGNNKALFDRLLVHRDEIEEMLSRALLWQRLDHRRASRIAIVYENYSITDAEDRLAQLRRQAVSDMALFVRVMQPQVEALSGQLPTGS